MVRFRDGGETSMRPSLLRRTLPASAKVAGENDEDDEEEGGEDGEDREDGEGGEAEGMQVEEAVAASDGLTPRSAPATPPTTRKAERSYHRAANEAANEAAHEGVGGADVVGILKRELLDLEARMASQAHGDDEFSET